MELSAAELAGSAARPAISPWVVRTRRFPELTSPRFPADLTAAGVFRMPFESFGTGLV
jgi:hypothetical protein